MSGEQTQRLLGFLSNAASYPHRPAHVTMIQTHASWVFIASPFVYKIKKPVNFGFLDFTTLDKRKADCERELLLNRRLADDIYLGLESICEADGQLQFGDDAVVVEYAVKMREMDPRFFLKRRVHEDAVGSDEMERLIQKLYHFYTTEPPPPDSERAAAMGRIEQSTEGNFEAARQFVSHSLSQASLHATSHYTRLFLTRQRHLFESRIHEGWIRDCHGDLHLEHIHVTAEAIRIFDCVEFNKDFRFIDVASDLAFLAMDLDFNARSDLANDLVERFSVLFHDDGLKKLIDFYKCYRACVRGKVESLHSIAETAPAAEKEASLELSKRYFRLALQYAINGSEARAIVMMGQVASGKSALAEALAAETAWPIVSSDRVRKTIANVPLHQRGTPAERSALYAPQMTQQVYAEISNRVLESLRCRRPMIVDATFSRREDRDRLLHLLDHEGFAATWVEAHAGDSITRVRLQQRETNEGVVSDARIEDYERLSRRYEPADELPEAVRLRIDTSSTTDRSVHELLMQMAGRCALSAA